MGKIFCLMGKSSSGKDTIFKMLKEEMPNLLKPIITYTTRPQREHEQEGMEYHFIDEVTLQSYAAAGKIIEKRVYDTVNGEWKYATIDDGSVDLQDNDYLMITTLEAFRELKGYYGSDAVVPIYIATDDQVRLERARARESMQVHPNYQEVNRRFAADEIDFSEHNLQSSGIKKIYYNDDLVECVAAIKSDILNAIFELDRRKG